MPITSAASRLTAPIAPAASTLVIIDSNVSDCQLLASGVPATVDVVVLDGDRDGVEQVTDILQWHPQIMTLHLVTHGTPGAVYLGSTLLNLDAIAHYEKSLQGWEVGDLLLYGCEVAAGNVGMEFLQKLHQVTGAAIAASTTKTGHQSLGGNWQMEAVIGTLQPQPAVVFSESIQQQYVGVLATLNADDYAALKALYQSTNGAGWANNTGWSTWDFSSDAPPPLSVVSQWYGVTLDGDRVAKLEFSDNNLTGTIPAELGNLSKLRALNFYTNGLFGSIPTELGNLSDLTYFDLGNNQLSGGLPTELANLSNLEKLYLDGNQLTGSIPTEFGNLSKLQTLYLASNQLSGDLPSVLGNLSNLTDLRLQKNNLSGSIPVEFGNLVNLNWLDISNNALSGSVPNELTNLTNLQTLYLSDNQLSGQIPQAIIDKLDAQITEYNLNNAPFFNTIGNQYTTPGRPITLNLSLSDLDVGGNDTNLKLLVNFSNSNVIDTNGVSITGTGSDRVITLTPIAGEIGSSRITVTLKDISGEKTVKAFFFIVQPPLNEQDYAALKAIYENTDGANWADNTGWKDWDFNSDTPPSIGLVAQWKGITLSDDRIQEIDLHGNALDGTIPAELGNLSNLVTLNLEGNDLRGSIPSELGNLSKLTSLNLSLNGLSGTIPSELNKLNDLNDLYLSNNRLGGEIPAALLGKLGNQISNYNLNNAPYITTVDDQYAVQDQALTLNLSIADIDQGSNDTDLVFSITSDNTDLIDSSGISVSGTGSDRTIIFTPKSGQSGSATITMVLQDQSGERTEKTFTLNVEQTLNADDYAALKAIYESAGGTNWTDNTGWKDWDFSSTAPPALSIVSQWKGVGLDGDRVTWLDLAENQLNGSIPVEIGNLSKLQGLYLFNNQLSGALPTQLGNLSGLEVLYLYNNQLSGSIPSTLGNLSKLGGIALDGNQLSGSIPATLGNLSEATYFNLSNNQLSGSIPSELGNLGNIGALYLWGNQLSGSIPVELGNLSSLKQLDLGNNQLSGNIPNQLGNLSNLQRLRLTGNQLSGDIPTQLANLSNLVALRLGSNQLSGDIPSVLGNLSNLVTLSLSSNQLSGGIPVELGNLSKLQYLYLSENQLSGSIPTQLASLSNLQELYLFNNQLSGSIPSQLGSLSNLTQLSLDGNQLSGSIPAELGNLSKLVFLDLRSLPLSGSIPVEVGKLSNLVEIHLEDTQLSGSIPAELGNLVKLKYLNLSNAQFSGTIPSQLSDLSNLIRLYLNNNQLSGDVPQALIDKLGSLTDYDLNNTPFVTTIADQTTAEGQPLTLTLFISDIDKSGNDTNLSLSFTSNNTALIDSNNISVSGTGSDRTVTFTPISGQSGSATITMTLQDQSGETTVKTFTLSVEPLPVEPSLSIGDVTVNESDGTAIVTVQLNAQSDEAVTVDVATVDSEALANQDYTAKTETITFSPGETEKAITIDINDDLVHEGTETFQIDLSNAVNAAISAGQATVTLTDNDPEPQIRIQSGKIQEGDKGKTASKFKVKLSGPSAQTISVDYSTSDNTAEAGRDYKTTTGTLTFAPGETEKVIAVKVLGDQSYENRETYSVRLTNAENSSINKAKGNGLILNDDLRPELRVADVVVKEGDRGKTEANFVFTLDGETEVKTVVEYKTVDKSANGDKDYIVTKGKLIFRPGQTEKVVSVGVMGDTEVENTEVFQLEIIRASDAEIIRGKATATIQDNDRSTTSRGQAIDPLIGTSMTIASTSDGLIASATDALFQPNLHQRTVEFEATQLTQVSIRSGNTNRLFDASPLTSLGQDYSMLMVRPETSE